MNQLCWRRRRKIDATLTTIRLDATQYCDRFMNALEKLCKYVWRRYDTNTNAIVKKSVSNGAPRYQRRPNITKKNVDANDTALTIFTVFTNDWRII